MAEDVRIPFIMDVKSVRILTAEETAAEREAAKDVPLGPHDVILPIKGAENLRYSPGLQDEIKRVQRAFDRRQAAEARRAALARDARQRYIPPGTPPMLRRLYQNMLPSPDDPRPEDFPPDDATPNDETPDDAPDRSGPTALGGLRSRYPRLFRSPQPPAPLTGDDPPQAAPSQDAATSSDVSDANPSPLPQTPAPMADTTSNTAADDDDGVALLASIDPLSHVTPASTHGLVQYASNDRVQFDAVSTGEQTKALPAMPKQVASQTTADPDTHTREESEAFDNVVVDQTISELPSLSEDQVDLPHFMLYLADPNREAYHIDVYSDSEGNLTTGIGHKILPADHLTADDLISDNEVKAFFQKDAKGALDAAREQMAEARITDHDFLFPLAAVNLQLGSHWKDPPGGFTKTWAYIMEGEYGKAADEAGKSKWIQQTPVRVKQFQDALHALAQKKE